MLAVRIETTYGRLGAVLSALIVCACIIGLTMHRDFYAGKPRKDFLCFYTNVSNLAVLIYFMLIAPWLYAKAPLRSLIAHAEFAVMLLIMLTFCVFHLLLYPAIRQAMKEIPRTPAYWILYVDNLIIHYIVPWMVFAYWLLCSPEKQTLGTGDALYWTILPLIYTALILMRARTGRIIEEAASPYPYPFLDAGTLGRKRVLTICAALYAAACTASFACLVLIRSLFAIFGSGHALMLI